MNTLKIKSISISLIIILSWSSSSFGQDAKTPVLSAYDSIQILSVNGLITSVYDLISGPAGIRNWDKLQAFCLPNASFISIKIKPDGEEVYFNGTIHDYIEMISPVLEQNAYYENEIERSVQSSDNIANVFSTFESYSYEKDATLNQKGVNSFQLIYLDKRWWIANILWKNEPMEMRFQYRDE
ncbi:MAG: hypothetical protein ISR55_07000 [Bacteroidetes bacterium]|nr:hypothetical protein [Bacteroidota bacterium]